MNIEDAKERIFVRLCKEYRIYGAAGQVAWKDLFQELDIPEDVFVEAMKELRAAADLYVTLAEDHNSIRLGKIWRDRCGG